MYSRAHMLQDGSSLDDKVPQEDDPKVVKISQRRLQQEKKKKRGESQKYFLCMYALSLLSFFINVMIIVINTVIVIAYAFSFLHTLTQKKTELV